MFLSSLVSSRRWRWPFFLFCALALQTLLLATPGYFSHDEFQWAAIAADPVRIAQTDWRVVAYSFVDWGEFQFRPLTFNLWMLLSRALFETPHLFHAVFALAGSLNGLLLALVLRRAGCRDGVAFGAALVFVASPFAAWVHGWVGCLGDLLWVGFGLMTVAVLQRLGSDVRSLAMAACTATVATALGLYSKEAALSIPALLGLATVLLRFPRPWLVATIASGLLAVAYLALRLDVLLHPGEASTYAVQPMALPQRWAEYLIFPWALGIIEIRALTLTAWSRLVLLALAAAMLPLALWRAGLKFAFVWLAGGFLALAPVLVLPLSWNQYGYGYAALVCGIAALAWAQLSRNWRTLLVALALVSIVHGVQVQWRMFQIGTLQSVFSPSLAQAAQAQPQGDIRLWAEKSGQSYIYTRLSFHIPSYHGVMLGTRVTMAAQREEATHLVARDGTVRAVDEGTP